jgi:peptidoglycan/xylan/chitin deacetylase (PgdA/CDA1 family)
MSRYALVNIVFALLILAAIGLGQNGYFPIWGYVVLAVLYSAICAYGTSVMSFQFFMPARCRGPKDARSIAVTFDDGPVADKTDRLLDLLKQHQVPAAFFCIGNRVKENMPLVQRAHAEGHLVGNHSYWHGTLFDLLPAGRVERELADTDKAIHAAIGLTPRLFRPPYGVTNPMIARVMKRKQYTAVGWSVRSFDTVTEDRAKLLDRVTRSLKGGDVVLFHDHCESTLEILPAFFEHVGKLGLKIVRIDELIGEKAYR